MPSPPRYSLAVHERSNSNTEYSNAEEVNVSRLARLVNRFGRQNSNPAFLAGTNLPMMRPRTPEKKVLTRRPNTPTKRHATKRRRPGHKKRGGGRTRRTRR
jgi:hypothetical protein